MKNRFSPSGVQGWRERRDRLEKEERLRFKAIAWEAARRIAESSIASLYGNIPMVAGDIGLEETEFRLPPPEDHELFEATTRPIWTTFTSSKIDSSALSIATKTVVFRAVTFASKIGATKVTWRTWLPEDEVKVEWIPITLAYYGEKIRAAMDAQGPSRGVRTFFDREPRVFSEWLSEVLKAISPREVPEWVRKGGR